MRPKPLMSPFNSGLTADNDSWLVKAAVPSASLPALPENFSGGRSAPFVPRASGKPVADALPPISEMANSL